MHINGIYILDIFFVTPSFWYDAKSKWATCNFNYLPLKIKFGIFQLKLANKLQESPDHQTTMVITFKWHWNNIRYFDDVIMTSRFETQMGDQVIFISYPLKFDLV